MNLRKRLKKFGATALAIGFFFPGCHPSTAPDTKYSDSASPTPASGDAYIEASIGDATYLNPVLSTDSASNDINAQVYNGLVKYDKDIKLVGDLAESWEVKQGGLEIIFHLRKNVRWHDGVPFTAEDVKFTYEKLIDPNVKTAFGADYERVKKLEVVDPYTVRISYKEPFAPALETWGIGMIPKHIFEKGDFNNHPANRAPIGTGPYKFLEWKTDEKIVLTANPDYFEGRPFIDRYIYRIIPDSAVEFLELRQESIDSMGLTPDQYQAYPEFFRHYNKYRYPSFSYAFFGFNLKRALFKDRRVREALAHAINKEEIIKGVLLGFGKPATGPFPPTSWAYNPDLKDYDYDPELAKKLLADAGWKDSNGDGILDKDGKNFEFTLITNQGNKLRELSAVIIQNHLAKVGVKVNIRIIEWSSFIHNFVNKRDFDAIILAWNLSRDPDAYTIWHSSQQGETQYNFVGYENPEADKLWEEGRRTFDIKKRTEIYHRLHEIIHQDIPYIFLYYPEALPVIHKRVIGPEVAPAGIGWNFPKWFVPKAWQKYHYAAQ